MPAKANILTERVASRHSTSLLHCSAFTVENQGNTTVMFGFRKDGANLIDVRPGKSRTLEAAAGALFDEHLEIEFDESTVPDGVVPSSMCLILRQRVDPTTC